MLMTVASYSRICCMKLAVVVAVFALLPFRGSSASADVLDASREVVHDAGTAEGDGSSSVAPAAGPTDPHHAGTGAAFPPEDRVEDDPELPQGTVRFVLRDVDEKPVTDRLVTLGALASSVAEGENHAQFAMQSDARGEGMFRNLEIGSRIAYRVTVRSEGGLFAASPFRLPANHGIRVLLHVYAITHDPTRAGIYFDLTAAIELREDRFQIDEGIDVYNSSRMAWVPSDVRFPLASRATGFRAQPSMSDQTPVEVAGDIELRGTYPPGRHLVVFGWQYPWPGTDETSISLNTPPRTFAARILTPATRSVHLVVDGFPEPDLRVDGQGHRLLVTERRWTLYETLPTRLQMTLRGLPVAPVGRWVALTLTILFIALGVGVAAFQRKPSWSYVATSSQQDAILAALLDLERASTAGQVGPRTYTRTRDRLLNLLARALRPHP